MEATGYSRWFERLLAELGFEVWIFERIKRTSGRASPPYMSLKPLDLRVEKLSEDVAVVTFHLVDSGLVNRRTLVFKREMNGWKIVHIHASNIAVP